ncbi:NAD(P)H-binding protein [Stackebrandtia nassauensis]|uniref:NmrA family protein n=1 Tax=Stackebrandtia nassauensis (strain DSM 44728 / CIP 108903 / NRRL B-16338 / NBRC 102104 / LLR-40K-21) TaxID=446470 RepID=D3PVA2_STANL|nr:NAD(P)H-binding protein [Stackebrandtia nassauensis]ADD41155.1 NmrA family protein [Stackebrandtia nassauensis DSM 44728]
MTILVTGATGNVGRVLVEQLVAAGESVRGLTRDPSRAALPDGAEAVAGDFGDPDSVTAALEGVEAVFLLAMLALETPKVAELFPAAGVRRVVTMTTDAIDEDIDLGQFRAVEAAVEATGLEWTHVRPGEFALNKRDFWGPTIKADGVVCSAYPDAIGAPVHEADIAAVAATALTAEGHNGRIYRLRGPQSSHRQQAAAIAAATGREIRVERVTHNAERAQMIAQGVPAWAADHVLSYPVRWADEPCETTADVELVTGAPARDFGQWAADHAADFS